MKKDIGLIRVVTLKNKKLMESHGKLIERQFPDLTVETRCIPDQLKGIYDLGSEQIAIPKIIDLGLKLEAEKGVKAIIVSCAADPGVRALKERLGIPVIGAGSSVASLALAYGRKVGSLGISDHTPQPIKEILRDCLVAEAKPEGIKTTLDLMKKEAKKNSLIEAND
jgi:Asp/Glu/hydantoin racemase